MTFTRVACNQSPGGTPILKRWGSSPEILKSPKRVQRSGFVGVAWNFFYPKSYQFLQNTSSSVIFFHLNTLKGTEKAPAVDPLRSRDRVEVQHTKQYTKTLFLSLQRYHERGPRHFYIGVPPRKQSRVFICHPFLRYFHCISQVTLYSIFRRPNVCLQWDEKKVRNLSCNIPGRHLTNFR